MPETKTAARGLATVALLKVYFDKGQDHMEMFMPFLLDAIGASADSFITLDIRQTIFARHGLDIPDNPLKTLLSRATRRGAIRREGGRYFRDHAFSVPADLLATKQAIEREHAAIAEGLRSFAERHGLSIETNEDALGLLFEFLEQNHLAVLLPYEVHTTPNSRLALSTKVNKVVAGYIRETATQDSQSASYFQRMIEGYVLQNALLLRDIAMIGRRFMDLEAYLDSGILFRALGLEGDAEKLAGRRDWSF